MSMTNFEQYAGAWTALVTPMKNGEVNYADLKRLVEHQVAGGIDGILSVGTTGESPTLSNEEHIESWQYSPAVCDKVIESVF